MNLYIIDTPYGYMVSPRRLEFSSTLVTMNNSAIMNYELHTMCLKLVDKLYKDKETNERLKDEFIADAVNNNCSLIKWNDNKLSLPCFKEKKDANEFKKILDARKLLYLMNE